MYDVHNIMRKEMYAYKQNSYRKHCYMREKWRFNF